MQTKELLLRKNPKEDISDDLLLKCPSFKESLKLCKTFSGLDDKQLCMELGIDPGQWSRIWSGNAHFPDEKITAFMDLCGNIIPLRWLALHYGYELKPLKTALELENEVLKEKLAEKEKEMEVIKKWMKEVGR